MEKMIRPLSAKPKECLEAIKALLKQLPEEHANRMLAVFLSIVENSDVGIGSQRQASLRRLFTNRDLEAGDVYRCANVLFAAWRQDDAPASAGVTRRAWPSCEI